MGKDQLEENKGEVGGLLEGINADSYCGICFISGLGAEPSIRIGCGHVFHFNCIKQLL